jgi:uncharacterized protein (UPF0332 family)
VDPIRFLELARVLKGGHGTPENYRTAISRAYYAAFHVGVEALKAIGINPSEGPAGHGQVANCLGASGDSDPQKASAKLKTLHGRRRKADYAINDPRVETRREADHACLESNGIIEQINKLINESAKDAIKSEIKKVARERFRLTVK